MNFLDSLHDSPVARVIEALSPYLPASPTEEDVYGARLKAIAAGRITQGEIDALEAESERLARLARAEGLA